SGPASSSPPPTGSTPPTPPDRRASPGPLSTPGSSGSTVRREAGRAGAALYPAPRGFGRRLPRRDGATGAQGHAGARAGPGPAGGRARRRPPAARAGQAGDRDRPAGPRRLRLRGLRPATGEALTHGYTKRNGANWVDFLEHVEAWVPADVVRIYAVA